MIGILTILLLLLIRRISDNLTNTKRHRFENNAFKVKHLLHVDSCFFNLAFLSFYIKMQDLSVKLVLNLHFLAIKSNVLLKYQCQTDLLVCEIHTYKGMC